MSMVKCCSINMADRSAHDRDKLKSDESPDESESSTL